MRPVAPVFLAGSSGPGVQFRSPLAVFGVVVKEPNLRIQATIIRMSTHVNLSIYLSLHLSTYIDICMSIYLMKRGFHNYSNLLTHFVGR